MQQFRPTTRSGGRDGECERARLSRGTSSDDPDFPAPGRATAGLDTVTLAATYHIDPGRDPAAPVRPGGRRPVRGALPPGPRGGLGRAATRAAGTGLGGRAGPVRRGRATVLRGRTAGHRLDRADPQHPARSRPTRTSPWSTASASRIRTRCARPARRCASTRRRWPPRRCATPRSTRSRWRRCGQMGVTHLGHHEKTDGAWNAHTSKVLSVCCCTACREAWRRAGARRRGGDRRACSRSGSTTSSCPPARHTPTRCARKCSRRYAVCSRTPRSRCTPVPTRGRPARRPG